MLDEHDRQNGMLTEDQRNFLESNGRGYTRQNASWHRNQIRERVYNTILDFAVLFEYWSEDEREKVFDDSVSGEFGQGLAAMLALVYLETRPHGRFEYLLQRGVEEAERELKQSDRYRARTHFEVESIGPADFEEAIEKFGRGALPSLDDEEAHALLTLLRHSESVKQEDFESMKDELLADFKEFQDSLDEPSRTQAERTDSEVDHE